MSATRGNLRTNCIETNNKLKRTRQSLPTLTPTRRALSLLVNARRPVSPATAGFTFRSHFQPFSCRENDMDENAGQAEGTRDESTKGYRPLSSVVIVASIVEYDGMVAVGKWRLH